jgi:uncharacterized membrane protein YkoI
MKYPLQTLIAVATLSLGAMHTATADDDFEEMESIAKAFNLIPYEEAKTKALAAKPGVIEEAELENRKFKKGWDYEFEIIDADGKEWEVNIDAKTGKLTSIKRDWF